MEVLKLLEQGMFSCVSLHCMQCSRVVLVYNSPPKLVGEKEDRRFRAINVEVIAAHLFSGGTWTSWKARAKGNAFERTVTRKTYDSIEAFIWKAVDDLVEEQTKHAASKLQHEDVIIVAGDGAWAHRRSAGQFNYSVINLLTGKILFRQILTKSRFSQEKSKWGSNEWKVQHEGNVSSTSKSMEIIGFCKFEEWMRSLDLFPKWKFFVSDRDGQIEKYFSQAQMQSVKLLFDPGHVRKGLKKSLEKAFGISQKYRSYPLRITQWWMRILKLSELLANKDRGITLATRLTAELIEERRERIIFHFKRLWDYTVQHYTSIKCPSDCPCDYLPFYGSFLHLQSIPCPPGLLTQLPLEILLKICDYLEVPEPNEEEKDNEEESGTDHSEDEEKNATADEDETEKELDENTAADEDEIEKELDENADGDESESEQNENEDEDKNEDEEATESETVLPLPTAVEALTKLILDQKEQKKKNWDIANFGLTCKYLLACLLNFKKVSKQKPKSRSTLNTDNQKDAIKVAKLKNIVSIIRTQCPSFCHGFGTTRCENVNSVTAAFIPKRLEFWANYTHRVNWTTLAFNSESLLILYQSVFAKLGIPWENSLTARLCAIDRLRQKNTQRAKSIEKNARDLQLSHAKIARRAEEKEQSKKLAIERSLASAEYETQTEFTESEATENEREDTTGEPETIIPLKEEDLTKLKLQEVKKTAQQYQLVLSSGGKIFKKQKLINRLVQFTANPERFEMYVHKCKKRKRGGGEEGKGREKPHEKA